MSGLFHQRVGVRVGLLIALGVGGECLVLLEKLVGVGSVAELNEGGASEELRESLRRGEEKTTCRRRV